jgi:signal transduction histidine kinase
MHFTPAPALPDEAERLAVLAEYAILDTDADPLYDDFVLLATRLCGTPMAYISLIDHDRQWFKARTGGGPDETPRSIALCSHAIAQREVFVVEDTHADVRFAGNPLVTGAPHIRFYAGAPLVTPEGHAVGALCVADHVARQLSAGQIESLAALARHVVSQLELRRATLRQERTRRALEASERRLRDMNEHLEERVATRTLELRQLNDDLAAFGYSCAHDLRTPLRAIDGFSRILLEEAAASLNDEQRLYLDRIVANTVRMGELIDAILDFSRIGSKSPQVQRINPAALVREVVASHPGYRDDKVWQNLIDNALKFSRAQPRSEVTVEGWIEPGRACYAVSDNGPGFDPSQAHRLFRVFERLHPAAEHPGVGAGLAIVSRIVSRHGGRIRAESPSGGGARFIVEMPLARAGALTRVAEPETAAA